MIRHPKGTIVDTKDKQRLEKLEALFKEVAGLTFNHDEAVMLDGSGELTEADLNVCAVVTASNLGDALDKVDPNWSLKIGRAS